jgi:hypothetical protein
MRYQEFAYMVLLEGELHKRAGEGLLKYGKKAIDSYVGALRSAVGTAKEPVKKTIREKTKAKIEDKVKKTIRKKVAPKLIKTGVKTTAAGAKGMVDPIGLTKDVGKETYRYGKKSVPYVVGGGSIFYVGHRVGRKKKQENRS